jgi:hypothetical protein
MPTFAIGAKLLQLRAVSFGIELSADDGERAGGELLIVRAQFMTHDFEAPDRILGCPF